MRETAPAGTNGTIVVPMAANKTVSVNGVELGSDGNSTLPEGVNWAGVDGEGYRVNLTSGVGAFVVFAV
jgi:hypothetical protein